MLPTLNRHTVSTVSMENYYRPSGVIELGPTAIALSAGILGTVASAFPYAYAVFFLPIVQLKFLLIFIFILLFSEALSRLAIACKIRNTGIAMLLAMTSAAGLLYFCWAVWLDIYLHRGENPLDISLLGLITHPHWMWRLILALNEQGIWSIDYITPTGLMLWLVWSFEAVTLTFPVVGRLWTTVHATPFCEFCRKWGKPHSIAPLKTGNPRTLRQRLETHDLQCLTELGLVTAGENAWIAITLHACPTCSNIQTLTLTAVTRTFNKKKEPKVAKNEFVKNLHISAEEAQWIRELPSHLGSPEAAPKPPAPSMRSSR